MKIKKSKIETAKIRAGVVYHLTLDDILRSLHCFMSNCQMNPSKADISNGARSGGKSSNAHLTQEKKSKILIPKNNFPPYKNHQF